MSMIYKSIVGDTIDFRGLVYAPVNESGVVLLFGKVCSDLNIQIEEIKSSFPDCIARLYTGKGWERIAIEFEYQSKNFLLHKHNVNKCDMIVCWQNNWKGCPIEVIELKSVIKRLDNWKINSNDDSSYSKKCAVFDFLNENVDIGIVNIAKQLIARLLEIDDNIIIKPGVHHLGIFSPRRSFATITPAKTHLKINCFSRGMHIEGTKVSNDRFSPRWCSFSLYSICNVDYAISTLKTSHSLICDAINDNEKTNFFSQ